MLYACTFLMPQRVPMRDPRFGVPKANTESQAASLTVSMEQLRVVAEAFANAEDADTTKRIADMLRVGAFDDIQTVMNFADISRRGANKIRIVSSSQTMEVLRHFGYTESFLSGEGAARFAAHMRFKHETRVNYYIPRPGDPRLTSPHPIISIVHEFYQQIDGLIDFTRDRFNYDITRDTQSSDRMLREFIELLVEYTRGGSHALSDGIL